MTGRRLLLKGIAMRMREVAALSIQYSETMAGKLGINSTDLECLDLVTFGRDVTAGTLAEKTGLTTGAITTAIDRLERAGFVERQRNTSDRRQVVVVASSTRRRRAEPIGAPMRKIIDDVLAHHEDKQLEFLSQVLGELCEAAKQVIVSLRSDEKLEMRQMKGGNPSNPKIKQKKIVAPARDRL